MNEATMEIPMQTAVQEPTAPVDWLRNLQSFDLVEVRTPDGSIVPGTADRHGVDGLVHVRVMTALPRLLFDWGVAPKPPDVYPDYRLTGRTVSKSSAGYQAGIKDALKRIDWDRADEALLQNVWQAVSTTTPTKTADARISPAASGGWTRISVPAAGPSEVPLSQDYALVAVDFRDLQKVIWTSCDDLMNTMSEQDSQDPDALGLGVIPDAVTGIYVWAGTYENVDEDDEDFDSDNPQIIEGRFYRVPFGNIPPVLASMRALQ